MRDRASIDRVIELLEPTLAAVRAAGTEPTVIVLGATGDGKSTLLNYLNASEYEPALDRGENVARHNPASKAEAFRVGSRVAHSETQYPQVAAIDSIDGVKRSFADLPGFFDTGSTEAQRLCSAMAPQILQKNIDTIKGIVWVINRAQFRATRAANVKSMLRYFAKIFNGNHLELVKSLSIVVTQGDRTTNEDIVSLLREVVESLDNDNERRVLEAIIVELERNLHRIVISNIFDTGASRLEILRTIENLQEHPSASFDFSVYSELQERFVATLTEAATYYLDNKDRIANIKLQRARLYDLSTQRDTQQRIIEEIEAGATRRPVKLIQPAEAVCIWPSDCWADGNSGTARNNGSGFHNDMSSKGFRMEYLHEGGGKAGFKWRAIPQKTSKKLIVPDARNVYKEEYPQPAQGEKIRFDTVNREGGYSVQIDYDMARGCNIRGTLFLSPRKPEWRAATEQRDSLSIQIRDCETELLRLMGPALAGENFTQALERNFAQITRDEDFLNAVHKICELLNLRSETILRFLDTHPRAAGGLRAGAAAAVGLFAERAVAAAGAAEVPAAGAGAFAEGAAATPEP